MAAFTRVTLLATAVGAGWLIRVGARAGHAVREVPVATVTDADLLSLAGLPTAGAVVDGVPVLRVFGDYECAACQAFEREAGEGLRALARAGRLAVIYHHAPLRRHRRGPLAAELSYCGAALGYGASVHRALQDGVAEWSKAEPSIGGLLAAVTAGANPDSLRVCMTDGRSRPRVHADRRLADAFGVQSVPTVILDGVRLEASSHRALLRHIASRSNGRRPER